MCERFGYHCYITPFERPINHLSAVSYGHDEGLGNTDDIESKLKSLYENR